MEHFNWELFDHSPYSSNFAPSERSQRFNDNELMEDVKMWLSLQAADFFATGMQKPILRYYKCLNSGGDYVEK
jgi:hypothetical protein